jgi:hypothetical protein
MISSTDIPTDKNYEFHEGSNDDIEKINEDNERDHDQ